MERRSADGDGRNSLLSSLKAESGDELEKVLARLGKLTTAKEYKLALQACCQAKLWHRTLSLFTELEASELQPDVACFNAAARAFQNTGQIDKVRWLVAQMKAHGVRPDPVIVRIANRSFGMAISAHEKAGQWSHALSLLHQLTDACVTPDVVTFNAAVSACHKGGQWERAVSLLDQMRDAGVAPDAITYNAAISTCGKGDKWELALSLLEEMRHVGVAATVISFNAAASACEKAGQWERAISLLEDMRTAGLRPDVRTYNAAISACGKGGQWQQSLLILEQMDSAGVRSDAISSMPRPCPFLTRSRHSLFTHSALPCPCPFPHARSRHDSALAHTIPHRCSPTPSPFATRSARAVRAKSGSVLWRYWQRCVRGASIQASRA
jgi:pentatricopeptide repeat protein